MATLADIKTRIATEMVKDDLLDVLAAQLLLHIQRAVEFYADKRFWFNSIITTANTVGGSDAVTLPATVRAVGVLTIPALRSEVKPAQLDMLEEPGATETGVPRWYAYYGNQLKLQPVPDAAYALKIVGTAQAPVLTADADSNFWTNEAQDLIVARAKFTLYRSQYRDAEGAGLAAGEAAEALMHIQRETAKRNKVPLRAEVSNPRSSFNVYSGR